MDSNTRIFCTYAVTRGLGKDELFYSMVMAEFELQSTGHIEFQAEITFVPIMQYWYGTNGYEWRVVDVFISELFLLSIAVLFTLREFTSYMKSVSARSSGASRRNISPLNLTRSRRYPLSALLRKRLMFLCGRIMFR